MEYKIGDLVRIKKYEDVCKSSNIDLNKHFFDVYAGKLCTIKEIKDDQYVLMADCENLLYARKDSFELVEELDISSWNELFKGV